MSKKVSVSTRYYSFRFHVLIFASYLFNLVYGYFFGGDSAYYLFLCTSALFITVSILADFIKFRLAGFPVRAATEYTKLLFLCSCKLLPASTSFITVTTTLFVALAYTGGGMLQLYIMGVLFILQPIVLDYLYTGERTLILELVNLAGSSYKLSFEHEPQTD